MPGLTTKNCLLKICERVSNILNVRVCICIQIEAVKAEHAFSLSWITWCGYSWRLRLNLVTCDFKVYPRMLSHSFFFFKCPKRFTIPMLQFKVHTSGRIGGENKKKKKLQSKEQWWVRNFLLQFLASQRNPPWLPATLPCPLVVYVIFIEKWNVFV